MTLVSVRDLRGTLLAQCGAGAGDHIGIDSCTGRVALDRGTKW